MTMTIGQVYAHLLCEFDHWDICLTGLVLCDGALCWCETIDVDAEDVVYTIRPIDWTPECTEYLYDYRKAFPHWFHDVKPRDPVPVDGAMAAFREKWAGRNPIRAAAATFGRDDP